MKALPRSPGIVPRETIDTTGGIGRNTEKRNPYLFWGGNLGDPGIIDSWKPSDDPRPALENPNVSGGEITRRGRLFRQVRIHPS